MPTMLREAGTWIPVDIPEPLPSNRTVAPTGIATGVALGTPTLYAPIAGRTMIPAGIPTGASLGTPVLSQVTHRTVGPTGIPTAAAAGTPTVSIVAVPITHGSQASPSNTGYTAYYDTGLGRTLVQSDLTVHTGLVSLSDFVANGGTITKRWFQGGLIMDRDNVTLVACRAPNFSGYWSGVNHPFTLNWCTVDRPGTAGDDGINFTNYTAYRCNIGGSSDGAKINGNIVMRECYVRTKSQGGLDHNDGLQNNGGSGPVLIERCNIDVRPVNGGGGVNGAFFSADGMSGTTTLTDNWFAGGQYVIRLHENGVYVVNGNQVLNGSWITGVVTAQFAVSVTWANVSPNVLVDASGNVLSTIAAP